MNPHSMYWLTQVERARALVHHKQQQPVHHTVWWGPAKVQHGLWKQSRVPHAILHNMQLLMV